MQRQLLCRAQKFYFSIQCNTSFLTEEKLQLIYLNHAKENVLWEKGITQDYYK